LPIRNAWPSSRLDQCVTPSLFGGGVNGAGDDRVVIHRPRPTRRRLVLQPGDSTALVMCRQSITVGRDIPTRAAITVLDTPSAASRTIRARSANPARNDQNPVHPRAVSDHHHAAPTPAQDEQARTILAASNRQLANSRADLAMNCGPRARE